MKKYSTQMQAAKLGINTPQMQQVAAKEQVDIDWLREQVAQGSVVIPANIGHTSLSPEGVGCGLRTKINVNLGVSKDAFCYDAEMAKAQAAIKMGAAAIMDLSNYGKTHEFRQKLIQCSTAMIGTVPVYDALGFYEKELLEISAEEFLNVVEEHGKDGVDFVTIHAGINQHTAEVFERNPRLMNIVSRGGSLMYAWMRLNNRENPFYQYFDDLLQICRRYDLTLSLGDAMRPGGIHDSTDASQIQELLVLGELTKRAWAQDVQVMIEGPGHMSISDIAANVKLEKKLCHNAPFYVLGPLVTDIAPGYDHITGAIGGAIAAANGADFLCYVTPAEHLRLPTMEDMKEGIIAAKIAAHAADLAKGIKGAWEWDYRMSTARQELDWETMFNEAIDPIKARTYRESVQTEVEHSCSMCGKMCAIRTINKLRDGDQPGDSK